MVRLDLVDMVPKHLGLVRLLHQKCFPVDYPESFYQGLSGSSELVKLGYAADCLVGVVGCKLIEDTSSSRALYIMTLGVLEHYRRLGFASTLLGWAIEKAKKLQVSKIGLHVQTSNDAAMRFYTKHGFSIENTEPQYYPQLTPSGAHYMTRILDSA